MGDLLKIGVENGRPQGCALSGVRSDLQVLFDVSTVVFPEIILSLMYNSI